MEFEQLKTRFNTQYENLLPAITEALNQLFQRDLSIAVKLSDETDVTTLAAADDYPLVYIHFSSTGQTNYHHLITLPPGFVLKLMAWMLSTEPEEAVNDGHLEGLHEGANQIFGQAMAVLDGKEGTFAVQDLNLTLEETYDNKNFDFPETGVLSASYILSAEKETFTVKHYVVDQVVDKQESDEVTEEDSSAVADQPDTEEDLSESLDTESALSEEEFIGVHPADFEALNADGSGNGQTRNMDLLLDVELEILVELGKKSMLIRDVLKLGKGSVIELSKAAGEPLEIYISGRKLAEGEVVVVDDHFGIRITHLVGPKERLKSLV